MKRKFKITNLLNEFLRNLDISEEDNKKLKDARKLIRESIREAFRSRFEEHLSLLSIYGEYSQDDTAFDGKVKFLTQGSYQYKTLNRPNRVPPQQMDLDDGIYFQSSDVESIRGNKNKAKILFRFIEKTVSKLVEPNNWQIDKSKPTCVRIALRKDKHIDLPIYLVPDSVFDDFSSQSNSLKNEYEELGIAYYHTLPSQVMMAHKEKGWVASDPRKVIEWVLSNKKRFGKNFLKVCRIMKAWRDHQWEKSPLSSICIMAMVAYSMENIGETAKEMEFDELLFKVVWKMRECLERGVPDPENHDEYLDENMSPQKKQEIIKKMECLYSILGEVLLKEGNVSEKNKKLREQFGKFSPSESDSDILKKLIVMTPLVLVSPPVFAIPSVIPKAPSATTEGVPIIPESETMTIPTEWISWLDKNQPGLQVNAGNHISGILSFDAEYKALEKRLFFSPPSHGESYINDAYLVDIIFDKNGIPKVWEIGNRIMSRVVNENKSKADVHLNADGSCCLAFPWEVEQTIRKYPGIKEIMERLIIPYFYYQSYCEKFKEEPWKGRGHDHLSILQYYPESRTKQIDNIGISGYHYSCLPNSLQNRISLIGKTGKIYSNHLCLCARAIKAKKCDCGAVEGFNLLRKDIRKYYFTNKSA